MKNKDVKIIGISGPARSGKDTVAKIMAALLIETDAEDLQNHIIATESFAAPIKSMVAMLLDFFGYGSVMNKSSQEPFIEGDRKEEVLDRINASTRKMMQTLGTDWGRKMIDEDIWLNSMEHRFNAYGEAKKHGHDGVFVIITDVRFDNEAELIKQYGGTVIRIDTDRELSEVPAHESEGGISDCLVDTHIDNSTSREDLEDRVQGYLEGLLGCKLFNDEPIRIPEVMPDEED